MSNDSIDRVQTAIDEIRQGRAVIMTDDENRENEGDLICAASAATPEMINFMAREACGLICLAMSPDFVDRLQLPMMKDPNKDADVLRTAFTMSVDAAHGVTTGISAADRAHTIAVAISENAKPSDLVVPGHMFPLVAKHGGVQERPGHTEASVDLAKLAGLKAAGVICEIMNPDGTMARRPELLKYAEKHGLHMLTIEDLKIYLAAKPMASDVTRDGLSHSTAAY